MSIMCSKCAGNGRLVQFTELCVIFDILKKGGVIDSTKIDGNKLSEAQGISLLQYIYNN